MLCCDIFCSDYYARRCWKGLVGPRPAGYAPPELGTVAGPRGPWRLSSSSSRQYTSSRLIQPRRKVEVDPPPVFRLEGGFDHLQTFSRKEQPKPQNCLNHQKTWLPTPSPFLVISRRHKLCEGSRLLQKTSFHHYQWFNIQTFFTFFQQEEREKCWS